MSIEQGQYSLFSLMGIERVFSFTRMPKANTGREYNPGLAARLAKSGGSVVQVNGLPTIQVG